MLREKIRSGSEWAIKKLLRAVFKKLLGRFLLYDIGGDQVGPAFRVIWKRLGQVGTAAVARWRR